MLFARSDTMRLRPGGNVDKAVALLREREGLLDLGLSTPMRICVSETGKRGGRTVVTIMESENISDLFQRARNSAPEARSALSKRLDEVADPESWDSQIWQVR